MRILKGSPLSICRGEFVAKFTMFGCGSGILREKIQNLISKGNFQHRITHASLYVLSTGTAAYGKAKLLRSPVYTHLFVYAYTLVMKSSSMCIHAHDFCTGTINLSHTL